MCVLLCWGSLGFVCVPATALMLRRYERLKLFQGLIWLVSVPRDRAGTKRRKKKYWHLTWSQPLCLQAWLPEAAELRSSGAAGRGHMCWRSEKRSRCKDSGENASSQASRQLIRLAQPGDTQLPCPTSEGQIHPHQRSSPGPLTETGPARKPRVWQTKNNALGKNKARGSLEKASFWGTTPSLNQFFNPISDSKPVLRTPRPTSPA